MSSILIWERRLSNVFVMISGGGSLSFLSFGAAMVDVCVHHGGREELVLLSGDAICLQRDNLSRMMQKIWFR